MSHSADSTGTGTSPAGPEKPEGAKSPGRSGRSRRRPVQLLTASVFALAGIIFVTSFNTAKGTNLRTDTSLLKLSDLVQERSHKNRRLEETNSTLRDQVDTLAERDNGIPAAEERKLHDLERQAGTEPLSGKGLTVTLDDAPPDAGPRLPGYPDPQPNDLVIHQQDLQAVVNALWKGGARGIRVMDQRLISTSAVRCVGNTLILQGQVYSPPYRITAVGDRGKLKQALNESPQISTYQLYVHAYGLGWDVQEQDRTRLPGYTGAVNLHHARPVD